MTAEEAQKILQANFDVKPPGASADYFDALRLGIEALKRCKVLAEINPLWPAELLPGETKE